MEEYRSECFLWARSEYGASHLHSHVIGRVPWPYLQKGKKRHLCVEKGKETGLDEQLEISGNKTFFCMLSPHIEYILSPQDDNPKSHPVTESSLRDQSFWAMSSLLPKAQMRLSILGIYEFKDELSAHTPILRVRNVMKSLKEKREE